MKNTLSCRLSMYRSHVDEAIRHLSSVGIMRAEVGIQPGTRDEMLATAGGLRRKLDAAGMKAATVQGVIDLAAPDPIAAFRPWCVVAVELGAPIVFLSVSSLKDDLDGTYARLKLLGDLLAEYGLKAGLETHPDLVTNGDIGRRTMLNVNHPNIGVNYDTANVHYYNQGIDSVAELRKVLDWVVSVHLKDTDGSYHGWCFPALGEGIVDFKGVFTALNGRGFYGPWTLEIEGVKGDVFSLDLIRGRVERSVAHLRKLGCIE